MLASAKTMTNLGFKYIYLSMRKLNTVDKVLLHFSVQLKVRDSQFNMDVFEHVSWNV